MYPRKCLDIKASDLLYGLLRCLNQTNRIEWVSKLQSKWSSSNDTLICYSVRTGFNLLLGSLNLPAGSEVLVSAITIPQMIELLKSHQLVPVPIDIDMGSLAVKSEHLESSITKKTRMILVAHIFGCRMDLTEVVNFAAKHDLFVIEDCAQVFLADDYRGHPSATVSMFSFGAIKTATALGGAIFTIRQAELNQVMNHRVKEYPTITQFSFFQRLIKYSFLRLINHSSIYGSIFTFLELLRHDPDEIVMSLTRSFQTGNLSSQLQYQPATAQLALLYHRLSRYRTETIELRQASGYKLTRHFPNDAWWPGCHAKKHTFWIFPICVSNPLQTRLRLKEHGFDATLASSSLIALPKADKNESPTEAQLVLSKILYLPFDVSMPSKDLIRLAHLVAPDITRISK